MDLAAHSLRRHDHDRQAIYTFLATPIILRTSRNSNLAVSCAQLWIGQGHCLHYRHLQLLRSEPICHPSVLSVSLLWTLFSPIEFRESLEAIFPHRFQQRHLLPFWVAPVHVPLRDLCGIILTDIDFYTGPYGNPDQKTVIEVIKNWRTTPYQVTLAVVM